MAKRIRRDRGHWHVEVDPTNKIVQPVDPRQLPGRGPFIEPGKHLWVVLTAHRINPADAATGQDIHLDNENLMDISLPLCFLCSAHYGSSKEAKAECPGWTEL